MIDWMWLFPLLAAAFGWLANKFFIKLLFRPQNPIRFFGIFFQGIIPKRKEQIAQRLGKMVNEDLFSIDELLASISNSSNLDNLTPLVEAHIDNFLKVKLAKEMPMLSMFISEKTIGTLKNAFMEELGNMLPDLLNTYAGSLKKQVDLEKIITQKLSAIPNYCLENLLVGSFKNEIKTIEILGGAVGFVIGLLLVIIIAFAA